MPTPIITVYTPDSSLKNPVRMITSMIRDLIAGWELSWQLAARDTRAQYRQAVLGLFWIFILPLTHTLIWIFLNSSGVVALEQTSLPYPVYVFTGTMLWSIFVDSINAPLQKTVMAKPMLAKVNFPRESLIVSGVLQVVFNGIIKIVFLMGAMAVFGISPNWTWLYFPVGFTSLVLAGTTLGLLLTPVGLLYTDVEKSIPLLMQFLMYLSPVVFPMPTGSFAAYLFKLNPMTPLILTTRGWLVGGSVDYLYLFFLINMLFIVLLFIVWVVYRVALPIMIERMSA
jgi:lipopolysaccharide transport system permease protein